MAICAHLTDHLPGHLDGQRSRVVEPPTPLTHAWGSPPIVLRCGVARPAGFTPQSPLTTDVDGVLWFQQVAGRVVRWTAVRRTTNIELDIPTSYEGQGGFLVEIGQAISATIE